VRAAGATKNVLGGVMNASAVAIFLFSHDAAWRQVAMVAAILGCQPGAYAFRKVNEWLLRIVITALEFALAVGLFWRALPKSRRPPARPHSGAPFALEHRKEEKRGRAALEAARPAHRSTPGRVA
jgi:hypothetical protein